MHWDLVRDGLAVQSGTVDQLKAGPQDSIDLSLPLNKELILPNSEHFLNLSFRLKVDTPYAEKGFEIAKEQLGMVFPGEMPIGSDLPPAQEKLSWGGAIESIYPELISSLRSIQRQAPYARFNTGAQLCYLNL